MNVSFFPDFNNILKEHIILLLTSFHTGSNW